MCAECQDWVIQNDIRHKVSTTNHPETDSQTETKNREVTEMFAYHVLEGSDWLTAAPKVQTQVNSRVSKSRGQSPFCTLYGFQRKVCSTVLPHTSPVYSDPGQRNHAAAEKLNSAKHDQIEYANKHRIPAKYHEKGDDLMLFTKHLPADEFKLCEFTPKWTGPFKVPEYNPRNPNVKLDISDFPELSNICNKFHNSLLKPFKPNDNNPFTEWNLKRPGPVEDDRWEVENVLEFKSQQKTG